MSEPKELWEVARDAFDGKLFAYHELMTSRAKWESVANTVIAEHERRKADPYAHLKAAAADPTKQIRMNTGRGFVGNWHGLGHGWEWTNPPEDYEIRDKPKKVDWSTVDSISDAHVKKYFNPALDDIPSRWIPWGLPAFGEKCPVPEGVMVEVVLRLHQYGSPCPANSFNWRTKNVGSDIIAFRITGVNDQWEA